MDNAIQKAVDLAIFHERSKFLELIEEFVHYADSKDDRTRIHLLKSALTLSSEMEHTQESAAITQRICGLLGEESLAFNVCNPGMVSSNPE